MAETDETPKIPILHNRKGIGGIRTIATIFRDKGLKEIKFTPYEPGYIHAAIVNGYKMRSTMNQFFSDHPEYSHFRTVIPLSELRQRVEPELFIKEDQAIELQDQGLDRFIDSLTSIFLSDYKVSRKFSTGLKRKCEENEEIEQLIKRLSQDHDLQGVRYLGMSVWDLLVKINDPYKAIPICSALVKAQLADQYNIDHHNRQKKEVKKEGRVLSEGSIEDDPLAIELSKVMFEQGRIYITSMGTSKNPERERKTLSREITQELEQYLIESPEREQEIITASREVEGRGRYLGSKGGKRIRHTEGSYALNKKLQHFLTTKTPYKTNFPFELFLNTFGWTELKQLHSGNIYTLSEEEVKIFQRVLQNLAELGIKDSINYAMTIIVKEEEVTIINYFGQGIRLTVSYTQGNMKPNLTVKGFLDSMSILERK